MDTSVAPPPLVREPIRWKIVLRDIVVIYLVSLLGGFVIGFVCAVQGRPPSVVGIAISNALSVTIGFAISAALSPVRRWAHIGVALPGVWLTGLPNLLIGVTLTQWILGLPLLALSMGLGGALSYLLPRRKKRHQTPEPIAPSDSGSSC
jgi:hypothetical protein